MKAIYLDCFAGISGNMLLGAFLQAGVPQEALEARLQKLPLGQEYELQVQGTSRNGISAVYVEVLLKEDGSPEEPDEHHHHHHHHHAHRAWSDIRTLIEDSSLSGRVKGDSIAIFENLAAAEGKVHGRPKDQVAFHEVGAVDSIVDIVGTAICLEILGVERVLVSRINTGSGFVKCAHGLMPVPAPATAELLLGFPTCHRGPEIELTTPTGAAVVKTFATYEEHLPDSFTAEAIGYGAGSRQTDIPNVLRIYLGELASEHAD